MRGRVLILLDLLWVEAENGFDVNEHTAARALKAKTEYGSGPPSRQRARNEAARFAGLFRSLLIEWSSAA